MPSIGTATFGGGCFCCTEAVFKSLKGVKSVESGYAGGKMENPNYHEVSSGQTGHAEVIQIEFDLDLITYRDLLEVFFATHDSTTPNRQGADVGTQYRSIILYHDEEQKEVAQEMKSRTTNSVTQIVPFGKFYKAEGYHQNYFESNPGNPYCELVISPKLKKLREKFSSRLI